MDPNETLEHLRWLAKKITDDPSVVPAYTEQMADYFMALDSWISNGGFLPKPWSNPEPVPEILGQHAARK